MTTRLLALSLLGLGIAACGDDTTDGKRDLRRAPADASIIEDATVVEEEEDLARPKPDLVGARDMAAPLGPDSWCKQWTDAYCTLVARCGWPGGTLDDDACRASLAQQCPAGLAATVAAGRLTFDAKAAAQCLSMVGAIACPQFHERLRSDPAGAVPVCATVLAGKSVVGGDCPLGIECAAGSRCVFGAACPGKCAAYATVGGACDADKWCDGAKALCLGGKCAALPDKVGVACPDGFCVLPLACDLATQKCLAPTLEKSSCVDAATCFPGLVCVKATGAATGQCLAPRGQGEVCYDDGQCGIGAAGEALVCSGGACNTAPAVGAPCFNYRCARGAWCDAARLPPTCAALPGKGAACVQGGLCATGNYCAGGKCATLLADGAACAAHGQCASGRCYGGKCVGKDAPPCTP